ncbi:MAG: amino acid adenylation domain-containing protein [Desulfovibrio sp.]|nr:amino acid adenylation domain-containing protein [Desulfovibrio sp.]
MGEAPLSGVLNDILRETAARYPDHGVFFVGSGERESAFQGYAEMLACAQKMAHVLYRRGLKPGSPLILSVDFSQDFLGIFWGCLFSGVLPAPLAHMRTPQAASMEARKIYHVWQLTKAPVVADSSNERCFSVLQELFSGTGAQILSAQELLAEAAITDYQNTDSYTPQHDDTAILQFSSGSTGLPKGARLTHRNLMANIKALQIIEGAVPGDCMVSWLPYFHDFGLFGCHLMPLLAGMNQVKMDPFLFAQRPFLWMEMVHEHGAAITSATNTGIEHLCAYVELRGNRLPKVDLSCLRVWTVGAEMVSADSCRKLQDLLAPMGLARDILMPGYGLTETTLVATCHPRGTPVKRYEVNRKAMVDEGRIIFEPDEKAAAAFTSVGKAVPYCQVRVVDERGESLGPCRVGEVEVQGDNVIADYYHNPEATGASFNEGWFRTGDMGFVDAEGDVCIVGRYKEIIIVRGQNYYPADIENMALAGMEKSFRLVVACGAFDPAEGRELILLFYIPAKKNAGEEIIPLLQRMNEQISSLAGFGIDRFISMRQNDIPRTSSGKVIRAELVRDYLRGRFDDMVTPCAPPMPQKGTVLSSFNHERIVSEVWSSVLDLPPETVESGRNLFRLGGDSIRAMRIQARLEEIYRARMESNFCYLYPTFQQQVHYFHTRDFSIEPPQNELEAILQKIAASALGRKNESVGVSADLMSMFGDMGQIFSLSESVREVFPAVEVGQEFLKLTTIRDMANYLWPRVFPDKAGGDGDEYFPLMHFQETLYFHRKGFVRDEPSGLSCYIYLNARMECALDRDLFDRAFNYVIQRHPIMRAVIDEGGDKPRFRVLRSLPEFKARHVDAPGLSQEERREYMLKRGLELNDYRFDLTKWPLFFCEVTRFDEDSYLFAMNIDHMLVDGFSYMQVFDELFNTYDRMARGAEWELPAADMTFGDYVRIENIRRRTQEYKKAMDFQLELFKELPAKAQLPSKQNPAMLKEVQFDTFYQEIRPEIIESLNIVAGREEISLNSLLLAAYFKLVNIWTGQYDLIINMPVFNREQYFAGARKTVGSFIDIFPVRLQTRYREPVIAIARKAEAFTRKLLEVPVSSIELSRKLFSGQGQKATSMSSIIFSNSIGMYAGEVSGMQTVRLDTPEFRTGAPGTYLDLVIYDYRVRRNADDVYYFNWNYIRGLFDREFIKTLASQYQELLGEIIRQAEEEKPEFRGDAIIPPAYGELLAEVNDTGAEIPDAALHTLIEKQASLTPDGLALTCEERKLTYHQFNAEADNLAGRLAALGLGPGRFAALYLPRSPEMLIGQLAIMKAGGAYLPLDMDFPKERIAYILEDSGAELLLTTSHCLSRLEDMPARIAKILVVNRDASENDVPASLKGKVMTPSETCREGGGVAGAAQAGAHDPAYMIYTSGSTGKPKGVKISHRNIVNFLTWVKEEVGIAREDRLALVTSYAFDMTMTSNWVPFLCGASLHILDEEKTRDAGNLLKFISDTDITFLNVTPSHLSLLAGARDYLGAAAPPMRDGMRIMLGGELINVQDLNLWLKYCPTHRFINEYGPTEATVASTWFPIPVGENGTVEIQGVPIGKPVYNTQVYVLNEYRELCMPGVAGELYIGGEGVALGYRDKPEKNAWSFVESPFKPGCLLYRTGDVVRMREDGNIEFLGREDHQINLRGYRIEAGEIESVMREYPGVAEAVVVARKDASGGMILVAFYTGREANVRDMRSWLGSRLPEYMTPAHFEFLHEMPATASGKLDRNALPQVTVESGRQGLAAVPPKTALEKRIVGVWEDVLGITGLGITDNFWDVGGDSLKAMRLIVRMKKEGFIDFGLREAFEYQTVASIAERIQRPSSAAEQHCPSAAEAVLVELASPKEAGARLLCLPYACGNPAMYRELGGLLAGVCAVSAVNLPGHGGAGEALASIYQSADICVEHISHRDGDAPLVLLGYSFGGYVAYELARRLEKAGKPAAGLILVACPPPGVTGGLKAITESTDEEIIRYSREVYNYDFSVMTPAEREKYIRTLRADTRAMLEYVFNGIPVSTPVLNIVGNGEEEKELLTKMAAWDNVCASVRHCRIDGAHMLIKTHPGSLAAEIRTFIARKPPGENPV